jgi:urea transport system ATP-binding protein
MHVLALEIIVGARRRCVPWVPAPRPERLEPQLLILDQPTEGIQPNIAHEIGEVIQRLNREANLTVLRLEQKLPFARRVASDLHILDKGRRVVSGKIGALTDEPVRTHLTV